MQSVRVVREADVLHGGPVDYRERGEKKPLTTAEVAVEGGFRHARFRGDTSGRRAFDPVALD